MRSHKSAQMLLALSIFSSSLAGSASAAPALKPPSEAAKSQSSTQKIVFPQKFSLGTLYILNKHKAGDLLPHSGIVKSGKGRCLGEARGTLSFNLDRDSYLYFFPSYELIEHPEALSAINPSLINCVCLETVSTMVAIDRALPAVAKFNRLIRLEVNTSELTDKQLEPLKDMHSLQALAVGTNMLNGSCFQYLPSLPYMRDLNASDNMLSHKAYEYIGQCKNLIWMDLGRTGIKDEDVAKLTGLQNLYYLGLRGANFSSRGLAQLNKMRGLRILDLTGSSLNAGDLLVLKNSSISNLHLPKAKYSMIEMQALKKAMPHVRLRPADQTVDAETAATFGPLH